MALPVVPLPTDVVVVAGQDIPVRGLSTAEVTKLSKFADPVAAEAFLVSKGCDVSEAEALEWLEACGVDTVSPVLTRIGELSGLRAEDSKSTA